MQNNDLFQTSLSKVWVMPKTYPINAFFLVAILGGTFPLVILGTLNAIWLRVSKKAIYAGIILGSILFISEPLLMTYLTVNYPLIDIGNVAIGYRAGALLLYIYYIYILKKRFEQFIYFHEKKVDLIGPAFIYSIVGIFLREGLLYILGVK
ncbi:hypothetical protein ACFOZY_03760 [Chungangia koreensis]|uniref:Uncharacterized protein n=1 Tax=Chungangia koreensis TaxID=752657 RepID=A0ABV8X1X5_9LACT